MNEENTLLNQPKIESFVENASGLIKEGVAETGGCRVSQSARCARYARGEGMARERGGRERMWAGEAAEPPRAPQRAPLAL